MLTRPMPMTQADGTLFRRRAVSLPISQRSSPLLSAKASFRRLGSSRSGTDAPARLPLSFAPQERLFVFLSARLPGSQRDSPRPTHASAQGSRTIGKAVSRIRQSSTAGQPNTSGFNECPPVRRGGQAGTIKGKAVWETVSVALPGGAPQQPPQTPIWFIPLTPKGNNARAILRTTVSA